MKTTFRVEGLRELDAALGELPKAAARNVLRRVLKKAGQPIADMASQLAPDDPATGAPDLHTSILVTPALKNPTGKAEFAQTLRDGGSQSEAVQALRDARRAGSEAFAEMHIGPDARQFHAHLQEFGTINHGPQPFMRPAFDSQVGTALEIIKRDLGAEIVKTATRLARRRAKAAAKAAAGG